MDTPIPLEPARRADRRRLITTGALATAAAVGLVLAGHAHSVTVPGAVLMAVPILPAAWLGTVYAYTDVEADRVTSRRWTSRRVIPWRDLKDLRAVKTSTGVSNTWRVRVVGADRRTFHTLGAPAHRGSSTAPEFDEAVSRLKRDLRVTKPVGGHLAPEPYRITADLSETMRLLNGFATVLGLVLLIGAVGAMRPAWDAHRGHGVRGVFSTTSSECVRGTCNDYGDFGGADGSDHRTHVQLADAGQLSFGARIAAIDTGDRRYVYFTDGSSAWVKLSLLETLCATGLAYFGSRTLNDAARRRRERRLVAAAGKTAGSGA